MESRINPDATPFDRVVAGLAGLSLLCVFLLPSQSGASFPTYLLALLALVAGRERWCVFAKSGLLAGLLFALLVYFSASVWWSAEHPTRSVFSIYSRCLLVLAFVVALTVSLVRITGFLPWLSRGLAVGGGLAALAALINFWLHPTTDGRLTGLGQIDNSVVAALAFDAGLLFALSCALVDTGWWRMVGAVCVALLGLAVCATGSRGGYLGGAIGVWVLVVVGSARLVSRERLLWLLAPMLGAAAIGIALLVIRPEWLAIVFPRGDSFRLEIWGAHLQRLAAEGPWFGLGILTHDAIVLGGQEFLHPHNLYLASALQGGLVGLLLLLGLLICTASRLLRNLHRSEARLGSALLATGMSVYALDGWELIDKVGLSWMLIWVPVAVAAAVDFGGGEHTRHGDMNSPGRSCCAAGRRS